MNNNIFSYVVLPLIIFAVYWLANLARKKLVKPKTDDGIQTPGGFDKFLLYLITFIIVFSAFFSILGFIMQETEMGTVFLVLTLIFTAIVLYLRRKYDISYQENNEYFIWMDRGKEYKVFYENIVDWQPYNNEIKIFDETHPDNDYIHVNIAMIRPEILLQNVLEMTIDGKFDAANNQHLEESWRKNEIIHFLLQNHYDHLVEDYIDYYNNKRIKRKLSGLSPVEYRKQDTQLAA